jgi:hypothetical protein
MEFRGSWSVKISHHKNCRNRDMERQDIHHKNCRNHDMRNAEMRNCDMEFRRSRLGESRCLATGIHDMRNREMPKCEMRKAFYLGLMERQDISSQELPKSRNAKMRNCDMEFRRSRLGESRCLATGIRDMRNREMPKCEIATWSFGDRDLESRDASQQEFATCEIAKCRNAKCERHFI